MCRWLYCLHFIDSANMTLLMPVYLVHVYSTLYFVQRLYSLVSTDPIAGC